MTSPNQLPKVALCWPRFGPYHLARLDAVGQRLSDRFQICGVETNPGEGVYNWQPDQHRPDGWVRWTVTPTTSLLSLLDQMNPSVVFVNGWGYRDSREMLRWAFGKKVPVVLFSDSRQTDSTRKFWVEWIKRQIVGLCSAAVVAGPAHKNYLAQLGLPSSRIFLGLDVVDNEYFSSFRQQMKTSWETASETIRQQLGVDPYFLFVGRFVEKKNLSRLIQAYELYRGQAGHLAWKLLLVGDGELRNEITDLIRTRHLSDQIKLMPFQNYASLPAVYHQANAFLLPSFGDETWGLVVNEAMACGLPILVSDRCGCAESLVIEGQNGFHFSPFDVQQISEVLLKFWQLSSDEQKSMGTQSQQIIRSWSLDLFSEAVENAIAIANSSPQPAVYQRRFVDFLLRRLN